MASPPRVVNIGGPGRRRRAVVGLAGVGAGAALVAGVATACAAPAWATVAVVPFWVGALGLLQAREWT